MHIDNHLTTTFVVLSEGDGYGHAIGLDHPTAGEALIGCRQLLHGGIER